MSASTDSADSPAKGSRSVSRLAAVQALYQSDLADTAPTLVVDEFIGHRLGREIEGDQYKSADQVFFTDIVKGSFERRAEIDAAIAGVLPEKWPLERLENLVRAILRAGTYELMARPDVPTPVVIDEYMDVAHAFYSESEPSFINGVLDALSRRLRPSAPSASPS